MSQENTAILEAKAITMQFGGLKAVDGFELKIRKGELIGLIGPNGAGKTTVFNMLTGVYQPTSGDVLFNGKSIKGLKPYEISHLGVTRTFQNIRLFRELSVLDNSYSMAAAVLRSDNFLKQEAMLREKSMNLLGIFGLQSKAQDEAGSLPYGEQRKLEIIRALATDPQLICLDEPAAGMNHNETHHLMETIAKIRQDFKLSVLLIEHDMKLVMGICERIVVLDHGTKIEEGPPKQIQTSKKVIEAYLGTDEDLQGGH